MKRNILREKLNNDEPTLSTHIHTTWPSVVEALGHTGKYDYVEFVAEYGSFDLHDLDNLCRAAELYDMGSMIKVDQVYGNRVHVCYPTQGWVDMTYICIAQARPTLVLRDLPTGTNEITLRNDVQRQGWRSSNVKVVTGRYMGRRTCVAFCEFATHDFAEQAKKIGNFFMYT